MRIFDEIVRRLILFFDSIISFIIALFVGGFGVWSLFSGIELEINTVLSWILILLGTMSIVALAAKLRFEDRMSQIEKITSDNIYHNIDAIVARLPYKFGRLVRTQIRGFKEDIEDLTEHNALNVDDAEYFPILYKEALTIYKKSNIIATAVPRRYYFWGNPYILKSMSDFLKTKGKITRIFLLDNNDAEDDEVLSVLMDQAMMGIDVRYVFKRELDPGLINYALVSESLEFGWRVKVTSENRIRGFRVTNDKRELESMLMNLSKLLAMAKVFSQEEGENTIKVDALKK